jgi:hypothetical protein
MTAVFCVNTADRKAETWKTQLVPFTELEFAISDAAKGIAAAVAQVATERRDDPLAPSLDHGLDVFHTAYEANRVLAQHWKRAEGAWVQAEAADAQVDRAKQQGRDARGLAVAARSAWQKATAALKDVERLEAAWRRAHAALDVFRPDGRLNDRLWAEAEITAAAAELTGPEWAKVRNFLHDRRSLAFLDRMHASLAAAEPRVEWREAMAWRWWLRHRRPTPAANPLVALVRAAACQRPLDADDQAAYDRVSTVLKGTTRASSAVECMNSVLRMQQSRHRRMTQPMLDLKRLYWNSHPFRSGPRKDACPYQALGLQLPTFDFWGLLQSNPEDLTQPLSTLGNAT